MSKKKAIKLVKGRPTGSVNAFNVNLSAFIRETIESRQRFVHQREITDALIKKIGKNKIKDKEAFSRKTSVLIYAMKNRQTISQYSASDSTRERYYGKAEWLKKGKVKPEFAPKES